MLLMRMFYYSLPVFLDEIKWTTPYELLFAILFVIVLLWLTTPFSGAVRKLDHSLMDERYIYNAWLGLKPLWTVFWPYFLFFNFSVYALDTATIAGQLSVSTWDDIYFALIMPTIIWTIAVWRNSDNTQFQVWAVLARFGVVAVYFEYALKLLIRIDYPRLFFNCNEVVLDYAACF